jgi:copper chaperone CopZ
MESLRLNVEGMTCVNCARAIEISLKNHSLKAKVGNMDVLVSLGLKFCQKSPSLKP